MALGGVPFLYYGEELGLPNGAVDPDKREDPVATRNENEGGEGRDVSRTPMPWNGSPHNGFSTVAPWIASEDRPAQYTVEAQRNDPTAAVHRYRELIRVRKASPDLYDAPYERLDAPNEEIAIIRRGDTVVIANLSAADATVDTVGDAWAVEYVSRRADVGVGAGAITVPAETSVILTARNDR